jgi:hypothetical protein
MDDVRRMAQVFVELADTLADAFDVVDFLANFADRCVELLNADAAGLMLTDQRGGLTLLASTVEPARALENLELQVQEGPCVECFSTGHAVTNVDVDEARERWPRLAPAVIEAGFGASHALPMRSRGRVIGALNLFTDAEARLSDLDVAVGQAMADVATIGLLHQRNTHEQTLLSAQLQTALQSRIVVEQAKGALAARAGVSVDEAFGRLRGYARRNNLTLTEVASAVVDGATPPALLLAGES